jgi:HJR/Mrr/RecB family endonuclease
MLKIYPPSFEKDEDYDLELEVSNKYELQTETKNVNQDKNDKIFTDFDIYKRDPKKAIKSFIEELYLRKYEDNESKGKDFELFVQTFYEQSGYKVYNTAQKARNKHTTDYGRDLVVVRGGKYINIQLKHYGKSSIVEAKDAQVFIGSISPKITEAYLITTGKVSKEANKKIKKYKVEHLNTIKVKSIVNNADDARYNTMYGFFDGINEELLTELDITEETFAQNK